MNDSLSKHYDKCFSRGKQFEKELMYIFQRKGYETQESNEIEDKYKHIDFHAKGKDGEFYGVDAKAMKSIDYGSTVQDTFTYVEWLNVRGNKGWLYGEAEVIAFERLTDVILIRRLDLLDFCRGRVDRECYSKDAPSALYKVYNRPTRKDLISLIKLDDLPKEDVLVWEKIS